MRERSEGSVETKSENEAMMKDVGASCSCCCRQSLDGFGR